METLGQKVTAAREKKRLTLSRAAALTRIKIQNLEMIEQDDFSKMPAPTYAKGFIRIYAGLLGLDPEPLVQEYIDLHLNAPSREHAPTSRKPHHETMTQSEVEGEETGHLMHRLGGLFQTAKKKCQAAIPHLPRLVFALVLVLLLIGMVRCAIRLGAGSDAATTAPARLDPHAIMKEPPVRYLELPPSGDAKP